MDRRLLVCPPQAPFTHPLLFVGLRAVLSAAAALIVGPLFATGDLAARDATRWLRHGLLRGSGTAATAAAIIEPSGYWLAALIFVPLYLTYRTYKVYVHRVECQQRQVEQTSNLHLATVEALARAIDAKDRTARTHIRRVQVYAAGLAGAVGLSEAEIQGVKTAALLHDIGKLAVPEHILSKAGPLTEEEFQKIQIHPQVGAEIIAAVPFPYLVAPLVLGHHERWDGKGYPAGLKGDEIPIGARILAIADYFDVVTTDRPYHRALSHEAAIGLIRHESGKALDPALASAFIDLLPGLVAEAAADEQEARPAAVGQPPGYSSAIVTGKAPQEALEHIALAHHQIYGLYQIAQAMGTSLGVVDTIALLSSKLVDVVPWSGCALFLHQRESDTLRCRFAAGVDAPRLLGCTIRRWEGLSGWVAGTRRTPVDSHPRVTFDAAGVTAPISLQSAMVCPLYGNDRFLGLLALYHIDAARYTEDHRRLLERVAAQVGTAIHNSIVFEQIQEDSLTDPLTGLPNRRSIVVHLTHEFTRAERLRHPVALIVLDIDELKAVNDTYGHHVGDRALREIAGALQRALRPYDLCARLAGDEFIVVLSDCRREAAEAKCLELQGLIGRIDFEACPGMSARLSASAGAAVFPHDGATCEALLAFADQEMYRAKALRRGGGALPAPTSPDFPHRDGLDDGRIVSGTIPSRLERLA